MSWEGYWRAMSGADSGGVDAVLRALPAATPYRLSLPTPLRTELAWVIEMESKWLPEATNPKTRATGLIQFMPATARVLGTTVDALRAMSRTEQAVYVQKFWDVVTNHGSRQCRTVGDVYLLVFAPGAIDKGDDETVYAIGTAGWRDNPSLRSPGGGPITAGSVRLRGTPRDLESDGSPHLPRKPWPPVPKPPPKPKPTGPTGPGPKPTGPTGPSGPGPVTPKPSGGGALLIALVVLVLSMGGSKA